MLKKSLIALLAAAMAAVCFARPADACIPQPFPPVPIPEPVAPTPTIDSPTAVVAVPIRITTFDVFGRPYWRAVYEVISTVEGKVPPYRIVMEWSCDPDGNDGANACAALAPEVLPGFANDGRATGSWVELDLAYPTTSSFDGVAVFGATHDAGLLERPPVVHFRGGEPGLLE